jgi:hypothetical protein
LDRASTRLSLETEAGYPLPCGERAPGDAGDQARCCRIARQAARVHAMIAGPSAMLTGAGSPVDGVIAEILLSVPTPSLRGSTCRASDYRSEGWGLSPSSQ